MSDLEPSGEIREHKRYAGEVGAGIRVLKPGDLEDMIRLYRTTQDEWVSHPDHVEELEDMTFEDVMDWASRKRHNASKIGNSGGYEILFGVTGSPDNTSLARHEVGEFQGFINCYNDLDTRKLVRRVSGQLGVKLTRETDLVELSIAKFPGALKGQMLSGLRQVCLEINKIKGKGANKVKGKYSKLMAPDMVVVAFIHPGNKASRRLFEEAGFEDKGLCYYDEEDMSKPLKEVGDHAYILNWDRLNQFMHQQSDAELLTRLGRKVI